MTHPPHPRRTYRWAKLRTARLAIAEANSEPCAICGQHLDYRADRRTKWGATVDHPDPIRLGGNPYPPIEELHPAHRYCQGLQGAAIANAVQGVGPGSRGGNPNTWQPRKPRKAPQSPPKPQPQPDTPPGAKRGERPDSSGANSSPPRKGEKTLSVPPGVSGGVPADPAQPRPMSRQLLTLAPDSAPLWLPGHSHGWDDESGFAAVPGLSPRPASATWPRFMTAPHPDAAGTLYPAFDAWTRERFGMHPKRTTGRRWWQELVARRALEVDADGRLCWDTICVSTPRQSGKSWLLREVCLARMALAERLGEVQTVVHTAVKLQHAFAVWKPAGRWAANRPEYVVRFANGEQQIEDPSDGSVWMIQAANEGLGVSLSVSLALVDEAWGVRRDLIDNALAPTMAEAEQPQLWIISTAGVPGRGEDMTDLVPGLRRLGAARDQREVLYLEWSAPRSADIDDPVVWRAASAHWDERRLARVASARSKAETPGAVESFRRQWLDQWPDAGPGADALVGGGVWARAGVPGLVRPRDRAVLGVALDERTGLWPVAAAWVVDRPGAVPRVGVQLVGVFGSQDEAVAAVERERGQACQLVVPRWLTRNQVRVPGVRQVWQATDDEAVQALRLGVHRVEAGLLVHDPADEATAVAVADLPAVRVARRYDAGTLLLLCALFAARPVERAGSA